MFSLDLEAWLEFVEFVIFTATTSTVWSPVVLTALSTDGSKNPRKKPRSKACMVRKWNGAGARRRGSWWSSMEWGLAPCYLMRSKYNETGGGLGDRTDDELWFFCGMNHCILKYVCFAERRKTTKNWVAISQRLEAYRHIEHFYRGYRMLRKASSQFWSFHRGHRTAPVETSSLKKKRSKYSFRKKINTKSYFAATFLFFVHMWHLRYVS